MKNPFFSRLLPFLLFSSSSLVLQANAGLVDDIVAAITNASTCAACLSLFGVLNGVALLGDKTFSDVLNGVCQALNVEDDLVCEGMMLSQGPVLAQNLRKTDTFTDNTKKMCGAILGLCDAPAVNPYTFPFPKAAPKIPKVWTSTGKKPFKVVQFTDAHVDRRYTAGTEAACTKPICCHQTDNLATGIVTPAGKVATRHCDTSPALLRALLTSANSENPAFSIFTGDIIDAAMWSITPEGNVDALTTFDNDMAANLKGPVYPTIGNHESSPANLFPRTTTNAVKDFQWIFDTQSAGWSRWLGTTAAKSVKDKSGSYSIVPPGTNLRIINLNTVYWYKMNFYLYDSDTFQPDPNGILSFLIAELQAAEDAGQRAWVVGHMQPGGEDTLRDQSRYFDDITKRYRNVIAAQFYGHSHRDEFAVGYSDYTSRTSLNAISMAYVAPPITPRDTNPAYRVYEIDPDTYEVMDSVTYTGDINEVGFQDKPTFKPLYSARQTYSTSAPSSSSLVQWPATAPLNATFWHKVTEAFEKDDALFQKWYGLKEGNTPGRVASCDATCKQKTICAMRALRAEDNCFKPTFGIQLRRSLPSSTNGKLVYDRRSGSDATHMHKGTDRCEGPGIASILSRSVNMLSEEEIRRLRAKLEAILGDIEAPNSAVAEVAREEVARRAHQRRHQR